MWIYFYLLASCNYKTMFSYLVILNLLQDLDFIIQAFNAKKITKIILGKKRNFRPSRPL